MGKFRFNGIDWLILKKWDRMAVMGSDITSILFWFGSIYFLVSIWIAFYLPGSFLLRRISLSTFQRVVLAAIIGMVMWGIQGYVFGYLHARFLSYLYVAAFTILWIIQRLKSRERLKLSVRFDEVDWLAVFVLCAGAVIQLSGVWFMGTVAGGGLRMCCGHPPDNNLELAITNEIVHRFPPFEPGMFGVFIHNYHYWSHLVVGELVRVFGLPLIATEYQYMTVLISVGLGLSAIVLAQLLSLKSSFIRWFLFFLYFSGELTYLTIFIVTRRIDFSIGSVENSAQFLMNYPRAFAIVILFGMLSIFVLWLRKKKGYLWYMCCIICGLLIGFKVYVGIFALSGLCGLFIYYLVKRQLSKMVPIVVALLISLAIYIPVNYGAGGLYFTGLWRVENYAGIAQYHLGNAVMAFDIYRQHHNVLRMIEYGVFFSLLYVVSSLGLKALGVIQSRKSLALVPLELHVFLGSGILVSFLLGMFFSQKVGGANTFNFIVTIIIVGSFYAALSVSYFVDRMKPGLSKLIICALIIAISIPRLIYMESTNISQITNHSLDMPHEELSALRFLRTKTPVTALILVDPRAGLSDSLGPNVSYLADRSTYYSGIKNELHEHGIDFAGREHIVNTIFESRDQALVRSYLADSGISYLLTTNTGKLAAGESAVTTEVFRNPEFRILKVK